jgi:PAS domain S-box-containing protein
MSKPIRILLVEDCSSDAELILAELERNGYVPGWRRVDTAADLSAVLDHPWDVITCDWAMPNFGAEAALRIIQERRLDTPVIIVSGNVGEETAVLAMKAGASDFVSKHRLVRLVPAIEREVREAQDRAQRRAAEAARRRSEASLWAVLNNTLQSFVLMDRNGIVQAFNQLASVRGELFLGMPAMREGASIFEVLPEEYRGSARQSFDRALAEELVSYEVSLPTPGRPSWFQVSYIPIREENEVTGVCMSVLDVSERRYAEEALRLSERRVRLALEAAELVAWEWDLGTDQLTYLQPDREDGDIPRPRTLGQLLEMISPEERERVAQAVRDCLESGVGLDTEFHVVCRDGSRKTIRERGAVIRDRRGRPIRITGVASSLASKGRQK